MRLVIAFAVLASIVANSGAVRAASGRTESAAEILAAQIKMRPSPDEPKQPPAPDALASYDIPATPSRHSPAEGIIALLRLLASKNGLLVAMAGGALLALGNWLFGRRGA